jgi:hypothetical protein
MSAAPSDHVRLAVVRERPRWDFARWLVAGLGLGGAGLFALSFFQVWWRFWLYAPQYPGGLRLAISLTGMGGDVHEIDLLNHYIGMAHLEDAAPVERRLAAYGVALIAVVSVGVLLAAGKRLGWLAAFPAVAFPAAFLADSVGWLYSFGHHLNPRAPLKIGAFTPELFGNGKVGQFDTFAQPALGFWIALAGTACIVAAVIFRARVCAHCARASTCGPTCPRLLVLPERQA